MPRSSWLCEGRSQRACKCSPKLLVERIGALSVASALAGYILEALGSAQPALHQALQFDGMQYAIMTWEIFSRKRFRSDPPVLKTFHDPLHCRYLVMPAPWGIRADQGRMWDPLTLRTTLSMPLHMLSPAHSDFCETQKPWQCTAEEVLPLPPGPHPLYSTQDTPRLCSLVATQTCPTDEVPPSAPHHFYARHMQDTSTHHALRSLDPLVL